MHEVSVINENGCMEDTSFADTTDYDTDFIGSLVKPTNSLDSSS